MSLKSNALSTVARVKDHAQIPSGDTSKDSAIEMYINGASDFIETYLNRGLVNANYTELYDGDGLNDRLYLKTAPITSVTQISIDGSVLDTGSYKVHGSEGYIKYLNGAWSKGDLNIEVQYNGGYVTPQYDNPGTLDRDLPFDIELAVFMLVGAMLNKRGNEGVSNSNSGGMSTTWASLMSGDIKALIKPYRWINV